MDNIIKELFSKLEEKIYVDEIAYLAIENGELIPIYKRDTELLTNEEWVEFHKEYRSFVKDSSLLIELVEKKITCAVEDTNKLPKKPIEFQKLNIASIYLFPVVDNDQVKGIVDIAYIGKCHKLTQDQLHQCNKIIKEYVNLLTSQNQA